MAMVMLEIAGRDSGASSIADKVTQSVFGLRNAVNGMTSPLSGLKGAVTEIGAAFGAWKALEYIKDATQMAARYETLGVTMTVVGNNAGYTREQMDSFEASLRKSGIAMIESRQNLTSMAQAHIDLTKSAQLARVAQDAAVIGGINSSEAFSRMIYGIQTAQVEVLRTIGLNVNFEDSYKKLAGQIGKNAADLTELEKTQARTNAVMEKGKDIAGSYESAMGTAGKQITSMKRYMDDLKVKAGEVFQDALTVAVAWATDGLKGLNKEAEDLAKKKQLDQWGRDSLMAMAFVADGIQGVILVVRTLTESIIWSGKTIYGWAGIAGNALTLNFSNVGAWWGWMNKNTNDYNSSMTRMYGNITSFQDKARDFLINKDAAAQNKSALDDQEKARMAAGAADRAAMEAKAKQEQTEKRYLESVKSTITGIRDYATAMKDLGAEQLKISDDKYNDKLKQAVELYKQGKLAVSDMTTPLRRHNVEVNDIYNQRMAIEKSALAKIGAEYEKFKGTISLSANAKEARAAGTEIIKAYKETASGILAVESERYKTLLDGERKYANEVLSLLNAKKAEITDLQNRFDEANKAFEEKKRSALGDYSGAYGYLDPNLDALAKRQAMIDKIRNDEAAANAIEDPTRKKEKLLAVADAYSQITDAVELGGQTVITQQQAWEFAQENRLRIQDQIKSALDAEKTALEQTYTTALSKIDQYQSRLRDLDIMIKSLSQTVEINLNVNGMDAINRIQSVVGGATSVTGNISYSGNPTDYYQVGDSMYWGDGSYAGPAFANGTPYVPRTGIALVHEGEAIISADQNRAGKAAALASVTTISFGDIRIELPNIFKLNAAQADEFARAAVPKIKEYLARAL